MSIDTSSGNLRSPNFEVNLHRANSVQNVCARVHLLETIHVPPNSEVFVKGEVRGHYQDQEGCLEPLLEFKGNNSLLIPKSVVKMSDSNVVLSVMNPTQDRKSLKKNIQVASVFPIEKVVSGTDNPETQVSKHENKAPEHLRPLVQNVSSRLSTAEREQLAKVVNAYSDIFVGPDGKLGHTNVVEHEIDTGDAKPIKLPLRRLPITQREVAEKEINKMLDQGIIQPSNSPWAAPIVLVRKRDS